MELIKITAGRHYAWFRKTFRDGITLPVRRPYLPPEGCHKGCGLMGVGAPKKIEVEPEPKVSFWQWVWNFIKALFRKFFCRKQKINFKEV